MHSIGVNSLSLSLWLRCSCCSDASERRLLESLGLQPQVCIMLTNIFLMTGACDRFLRLIAVNQLQLHNLMMGAEYCDSKVEYKGLH